MVVNQTHSDIIFSALPLPFSFIGDRGRFGKKYSSIIEIRELFWTLDEGLATLHC